MPCRVCRKSEEQLHPLHRLEQDPVDIPAIERELRKVNPAVRLVRERHLRRMKRELFDRDARQPSNPDDPLRVNRAFAESLSIFPTEVTHGEEPELVLFTDPDDRFLDGQSEADILRHYWERLFAEAVSQQCRNAIANGGAAERWAKLGPVVAAEAEFLLDAEHRVPSEPTREELYAAFVAKFARVLYFRPATLPILFPSVNRDEVLAAIAADVDLAALFRQTRPEKASEPKDLPVTHFPAAATKPAKHPERSEQYATAAKRAAEVHNDARAAILYQKAIHASPEGATRHYRAAHESLQNQLVPRLAKVLEWNAQTQAEWVAALKPLLLPAALGVWPTGAKALYDLQRVAIDLEQDLYAVDPASWIRSLGQRPMVRKLSLGRQVILLLHLKRVERHLTSTPLKDEDRAKLTKLLRDEIAVIDAKVRGEIGPKMLAVFDAVGFVPRNSSEEVARDKIVQELLDLACERGQFRLGHLRDAMARNRLKLQDLSGPGELFRGDVLLRADAALDRELDGVYVRGEAYLRAIQRGSALAFGTRIGRALCLYLLGPIIAAFLTVEFTKYLVHEIGTVYRLVSSLVRYQDKPAALVMIELPDGEIDYEWVTIQATPEKHGITIGPASLIAVGIIAIVVLLLIHWARFRDAFWLGLRWLWRGFVEIVLLPLTIWRSKVVMSVRRHPMYRWVARRLGLAFAVGCWSAAFLLIFGASLDRTLLFAGGAFVIVALAVNVPPGRWVTDAAEEVMSDSWRQIRVNLLPNILGWILWLFRELLATIDRMLYAVDEWLRFRTGQSRQSLWLKVAVGLIWFPIAYVFRFVIYLFVEPQVNPVKHFPVVTVSHKLLLPLIPTLAPTVAESLAMSEQRALGLLTLVIGCIPGVFGFIAWELKENWRLYAANRPRRLGAVPLGHHGESMRGLLRPGFHSGTIPTLYKRIRAAIRKADQAKTEVSAGKYLDGLHHVEHALHLFVERELIVQLHHAAEWQSIPLEPGHVSLGLQSVELQVICGLNPHRPAVFTFTHRDGTISGAQTEPGFTLELTDAQKESWEHAVQGLLAMAAVPVPEADSRTDWTEWTKFWAKRTA